MKKFALAAILLGFLLVGTLHVSLSRSPYFDEAINLYIGKVLARGGSYETGMLGSIWVYPTLISVILQVLQGYGVTGNNLINLAVPAVREVNVFFGTFTVLLVYLAANRLWGRDAAIWGAALFAFTGCVIFTSGFATYDILSLMFLAASVWLAIEATANRSPFLQIPLLAISGLALCLSIATKYIGVVFVPALVVIVALRNKWLGLLFLIATIAASFIAVQTYGDQISSLTDNLGGHGANYGSSPLVILFEVAYFVGPLLLIAFASLGFLEKRWTLGLVILAASLMTPMYHIAYNDPLSLFKQVMWTALFASLLAGVALAKFAKISLVMPLLLFGALAVFGWYQVRTLEQFYPDLTETNNWLLDNVTGNDCNILVDDAWTVRWALGNTFDTKEYCVTDQWRFKHELTSSTDLVRNVESGVYPYIVFEKGGMFNGDGAVFDQSVIDSVQNSGQYELIMSFPSYVTWGNAILPGQFKGVLMANSTVTIEIWKRR